ncbi:septin-2-like isoform X1 [Argiope bruennichi]|uniref:Septin n=1 Tax=Argiope bruennichi TaxID=94029 RepID=A0A8T0E8D3_ARGBR|nr:septin-2-like isoform X1 [Argiope bruennichi]KAF8768003.1 Septin-4 like protein [Argiope bruennichi]
MTAFMQRNESSFLANGAMKPYGEIGFATLPEQVHRKSVKKGFDFTLIVVGETGLGKSTLINSLFLTDLYKDRKILSVEERVDRTVDIEKTTIDIEEKGVKLRLTVIDTPGFGDAINCEENWKTIERYIDEQFNQFFKDESGLNRKNIIDNRVHCCLYFIPPYGHGLRQLDVEFMKRLHSKVNIVPIIAKADTLTPIEVRKLKDTILREVEEQQIKIYQLPECDSDEDEEFKQQDKELKESIPFAVIGSTQIVEINGRKVRGRLYPWGIVEVENPKHSDFLKLRTFLISTHMQDLKDVTRDVHYENYRAQYITKISQQAARERNKLRRDSGPNFEAVAETDRLLQQKEEEIRKMQDMLQQMQQKLRAAGTEEGQKEEARELNF